MFICYFKKKEGPRWDVIKNQSHLCTNGGLQQWKVNYWYIYSPVFKLVYFKESITLIILRNLHTKSVDLGLAYTQADVKLEKFIEPPILFGVEGSHPIELIIRIYKNRCDMKGAGLVF